MIKRKKVHECGKCDAEYILCSYHKNKRGLCHTCNRSKQTREIHPMLTIVRVSVSLKGFNLRRGLDTVESVKDDFMMVMEYNSKNEAYLLTAGGWTFWAKHDDIRAVHVSASQYIKNGYRPISTTERILNAAAKETKKLEKEPEVQALLARAEEKKNAEGYIPYSPVDWIKE